MDDQVCKVAPVLRVQSTPTCRYFDKHPKEKHPKPHALQHPAEFWKHTPFENAKEYADWKAEPAKLGKVTLALPHGGLSKQKYHDFADKIWEKFKLTKREILAATAVRDPKPL